LQRLPFADHLVVKDHFGIYAVLRSGSYSPIIRLLIRAISVHQW
jgi:hypothetical protein